MVKFHGWLCTLLSQSKKADANRTDWLQSPCIILSHVRKETCWSYKHVVDPAYNDIVVCDTSPIVSDIWYQSIPHGPVERRRYSDSLRARRSGDRIPVEARLSAPVQTGPGPHPASYTMRTGSFPRGKRPGRGVDHPLPSSDEVKERIELYLYSPYGPSWPFLGWNLPFPLPVNSSLLTPWLTFWHRSFTFKF